MSFLWKTTPLATLTPVNRLPTCWGAVLWGSPDRRRHTVWCRRWCCATAWGPPAASCLQSLFSSRCGKGWREREEDKEKREGESGPPFFWLTFFFFGRAAFNIYPKAAAAAAQKRQNAHMIFPLSRVSYSIFARVNKSPPRNSAVSGESLGAGVPKNLPFVY